MADYRDDPRWKEYGFGRSMFPTVASSEFTKAGAAGDAWEWFKEKMRSETTSPEAMKKRIPDYTPEKGELYKYLESSREDAERKALEDMERLRRETEEYGKTFKKIGFIEDLIAADMSDEEARPGREYIESLDKDSISMMKAIDEMVKDPSGIGILPTEEGTFPYGSEDLGRPVLPSIEASFKTPLELSLIHI